jgi:hypothetical protein
LAHGNNISKVKTLRAVVNRLQSGDGRHKSGTWVHLPELTLQPLPQEYLRLGDRQYRYSSRGGAFVANLIVDNDDLVVDYEGFWIRVSSNE